MNTHAGVRAPVRASVRACAYACAYVGGRQMPRRPFFKIDRGSGKDPDFAWLTYFMGKSKRSRYAEWGWDKNPRVRKPKKSDRRYR